MPSQPLLAPFLAHIREVIKDNAQAETGNLIAILNPKIRGWANYHQYVTSKKIFAKIDHAIFKALWQWAKRRHPKKGKRWIKDKYFASEGSQNWVFCGEREGRGGKPYWVRLCLATDTPIRRHTKIKGEANPYDPEWEIYFEERLGVKMVDNLKGK